MRLKGTLISLIILGFLVGLYIYEEKKDREKRQRKEEEQVIFKAKPEEVFELEIKKQGNLVVHLKKESNWEVIAPVTAKANNYDVERYIKHMVALRSERIVEEDTKDLATYGLSSPFLSIVVTTKQGKKGLNIGNMAPVGYTYYAQMGYERKVLSIGDNDVKELDRPLFYFREKRPMDIDPKGITKARFRGEGFECSLEKKEGIWKGEGEIDSDKVEMLVGRLVWAESLEIVEERASDLRRYKLDNPRFVLELESQEGVHQIALGATKEDEPKGIYAVSTRHPHVFLMPLWLSSSILKGCHELRPTKS